MLALSIPISVFGGTLVAMAIADAHSSNIFILQGVVPLSVSKALGWTIAVMGFILVQSTNSAFRKRANGTLSPASELASNRLIVDGAYAHVRNPMIGGVLFMFIGSAIILQSNRIAAFAVYFFVIKTAWFILCEEKSMRRRFGAEYDKYCRHVNRWLPRMKPYESK